MHSRFVRVFVGVVSVSVGLIASQETTRAGEAEFVRGRVDGVEQSPVVTVVRMLNVFIGGPAHFSDCSGEFCVDAADLNDNEYFTIADALLLAEGLPFRVPLLPHPNEECGSDPTDEKRGFDQVDERFTFYLTNLRVEGEQALVDVDVSAAEDVIAFSFSVEHPSWMGLAKEEFQATDALEISKMGAIGEDDRLTFTAVFADGKSPVLLSTEGERVRIGTIHFDLDEPGSPIGLAWRPESRIGQIVHRATVIPVSEAWLDRHPGLVSEVDDVPEPQSFRRGDADASGDLSQSDYEILVDFLWTEEREPRDCLGRRDLNVLDVNDNEAYTVADAMLLRHLIETGESPSAPFDECGADPDNSTRGFDAGLDVEDEDALWLVTGRPIVHEPDGAAVRGVTVPVYVNAPFDVIGVQFFVIYDSDFLLPLSPNPTGEADVPNDFFVSDLGEVRYRNYSGDAALVSVDLGVVSDALDGPDKFEDRNDHWHQIGSLRFIVDSFVELERDARGEPRVPVFLAPEGLPAGLASYPLRTSIVDNGFRDHRPTIGSGPALFVRGDSNLDSRIDLSDAIHTLSDLFLGASPVLCEDAADTNNNGIIDLSDAIYAIGFLFQGWLPPPPPHQ